MAAPRRLILYGVGTGKSGSLSLAKVFARDFRSAHEPESDRLVPLLCDVREGLASPRQLRRYLRGRDRRLHLEVDVSNLNGWITAELLDLHPRARFVLTWRHPTAWLDSLINHLLAHDPIPHWARLRDLTFGDTPHGPGEEPLSDRGLYSLDGFLTSWARRQEQVLADVPEEQLLVVRTEDLSRALPALARFAGVPPDTLDAERAHSHRTARKAGVVDELGPALLEERIAACCADTLDDLEARTITPQGGERSVGASG